MTTASDGPVRGARWPLTTHCSRSGRVQLTTILKQERESTAAFPEVVSIIKKYEGFTGARTKAEVIVGQALEPLQLFNGEEHEKSISLLQGLSAYVLKRDK